MEMDESANVKEEEEPGEPVEPEESKAVEDVKQVGGGKERKRMKEPKEPDEEQLKIKPLLRMLGKLVEAAQDGLQSSDDAVGSSSSKFLAFLLSNQKKLANFLPATMRLGVWNAYRKCGLPQRWQDRLLLDVISAAREKELLSMINSILADLQTVSTKVDPSTLAGRAGSTDEVLQADVELGRVSSLLCHLVAADIRHDHRFSLRMQAVQTALPLIQHMILVQCRQPNVDDVVRRALPPMNVYLTFLKAGKSYGYPQDVASALNVCLALPLDSVMEHAAFVDIFTVVYKVIHYLLTKHEEIAADRIPVLLQVYRRLLLHTAERSDQRRKAQYPETADLTECANQLSRLASVINTQRLRYRRVAAYLVADIMEQFQKRTLYPSVKHELATALNHLLDILDQHAARYLLSVLPAGVRELFRVEYEQFQKFYKFKGKV